MSIDYHTYVGPYVRCRVAFVDTPSYQTGCPNQGCPRYARPSPTNGGQFCSYCGTAIGQVAITEKKAAVDAWTLVDAIGHTLANASGGGAAEWERENGAHLWYTNAANDMERDYHLEEGIDFYTCEITPEQIREELAAFSQQFAEEIKLFRQHYGMNAVSVHWGVIQDYN